MGSNKNAVISYSIVFYEKAVGGSLASRSMFRYGVSSAVTYAILFKPKKVFP